MRIYLDLDGVIADFDKHFKDTFDSEPNDWPDSQMWKMINSYETFYADLPLMPDAQRFFWDLQVYCEEVIILTACPKSNYKNAALQKREWVRKHISRNVTILPVMGGANKALFMHSTDDVLIDDMKKNCDSWEELGGRAIVHKTIEQTIEELTEIYKNTYKPTGCR